MFEDEISPQVRNKWQKRAYELLTLINTIRKSTLDDTSNLDNEESLRPKIDIFNQLKECLWLGDLEAIIDEAELHDIYTQNEEYDKQVDHHIKSLSLQKQAKKLLESRKNPNLKKMRELIIKITRNGIKFKEAEVMAVTMDLFKRCSIAKGHKVTLELLEDLVVDLSEHTEAIDEVLIECINTRKNIFEVLKEKIEMFGMPNKLSEMDDSQLKPLIHEIRKHKMDSEALPRLESQVELCDSFRKINEALLGEDNSQKKIDTVYYENENKLAYYEILLAENSELLFQSQPGSSESVCEHVIGDLQPILHFVALDEPLEQFVCRLKNFIWRCKAKRMLTHNEESLYMLESCVSSIPNNLKDVSDEYSQLKERVHCIKTAKQREISVRKNLESYWKLSIEELIEREDDVRQFLQDVEGFFNEKFVERQIEVLDLTLKCFRKSNQGTGFIGSNSNIRLVEQHTLAQAVIGMPDERLFQEISVLAANSERATMFKKEMEIMRNKLGKMRDMLTLPMNGKTGIGNCKSNSKSKHKQSYALRDVLDQPRKDVNKSREIYKSLECLNGWIRGQFSDEIDILGNSLNYLSDMRRQAEDFKVEFQINGFLDEDVDDERVGKAIGAYNCLQEKYFYCDIKEEHLEDVLKEFELVLRGWKLLGKDGNFEVRRDISSWEGVIEKLKKLSLVPDQENFILLKQLEDKMKRAERLLMEAHKMRQFESQCSKGGVESQNRQARMLSIGALEKMIMDYESGTGEIELQDTMTYLKKIYEGVKANIAKSEEFLHFEELEVLKNKLQKQPLSIPLNYYGLINRRASKAREFKNKLEIVMNSKSGSKKIYDDLSTWIQEYEELKMQVLDFEEVIKKIDNEKKYETEIVVKLLNDYNDIKKFEEGCDTISRTVDGGEIGALGNGSVLVEDGSIEMMDGSFEGIARKEPDADENEQAKAMRALEEDSKDFFFEKAVIEKESCNENAKDNKNGMLKENQAVGGQEQQNKAHNDKSGVMIGAIGTMQMMNTQMVVEKIQNQNKNGLGTGYLLKEIQEKQQQKQNSNNGQNLGQQQTDLGSSKFQQPDNEETVLRLKKISEVRKVYNNHIYVKNDELLIGLLNREIEAIQTEYEKRLFGESSNNQAILNQKILENLVNDSSLSSSKVVNNICIKIKRNHSFIKKQLQDVNRFIEEKIRQSTTIGELHLNLNSNPFSEIVDLSLEIDDHKTSLIKSYNQYSNGGSVAANFSRKNSALNGAVSGKDYLGSEYYYMSGVSGDQQFSSQGQQYSKYQQQNFMNGQMSDKKYTENYSHTHQHQNSIHQHSKFNVPGQSSAQNIISGQQASSNNYYSQQQQQQNSYGGMMNNIGGRGDSNLNNKQQLSIKVRQSYISAIKLLMETNMAFNISNIDAMMAVKLLEKEMFESCNRHKYQNMKCFESYYKQVCIVFQKLSKFPAISSQLKKKHFKLSLIEQLFVKNNSEINELEKSLISKKMLLKKSSKNNKNQDNLDDSTTNYCQTSPAIPKKKKKIECQSGGFIAGCDLSSSENNKMHSNAKSSRINFYRVYTGSLYFKLRKSEQHKKADNAEMCTCNPADLIRGFGAIPSKLFLSTKICFNEFERYVQKCAKSVEYSLQLGWVRLKSSTQTAAKNYLEKNSVVASSQYTKKCKIFLFSKDQIKTSFFVEFLQANHFYMAKEDNEDIELLFIAILKNSGDNYEVPMYPESGEARKVSFYQLSSKNVGTVTDINEIKIDEKLIDPTTLLEERLNLDDNKNCREADEENFLENIGNGVDMQINDENTISCEPNEMPQKIYEKLGDSDDNFLFDDSSVEKVWKSQSDEWDQNQQRIDFGNQNQLTILKTNRNNNNNQQQNNHDGNTMKNGYPHNNTGGYHNGNNNRQEQSHINVQDNYLGKRGYPYHNKLGGGAQGQQNPNCFNDRTNILKNSNNSFYNIKKNFIGGNALAQGSKGERGSKVFQTGNEPSGAGANIGLLNQGNLYHQQQSNNHLMKFSYNNLNFIGDSHKGPGRYNYGSRKNFMTQTQTPLLTPHGEKNTDFSEKKIFENKYSQFIKMHKISDTMKQDFNPNDTIIDDVKGHQQGIENIEELQFEKPYESKYTKYINGGHGHHNVHKNHKKIARELCLMNIGNGGGSGNGFEGMGADMNSYSISNYNENVNGGCDGRGNGVGIGASRGEMNIIVDDMDQDVAGVNDMNINDMISNTVAKFQMNNK